MSATNRGAKRAERDLYPTPRDAFLPLIPYIKELDCSVWEPACGDGRLIEMMQAAGIRADGTDIAKGDDFLKDDSRENCIVTNPPFSLAFEFCKHAVKKSNRVFLLLRLNFLGSGKRAAWFKEHEPAALFVLSKRPSFTGGRTDSCEYAWFYWGPTFKGIHHLVLEKYRKRFTAEEQILHAIDKVIAKIAALNAKADAVEEVAVSFRDLPDKVETLNAYKLEVAKLRIKSNRLNTRKLIELKKKLSEFQTVPMPFLASDPSVVAPPATGIKTSAI